MLLVSMKLDSISLTEDALKGFKDTSFVEHEISSTLTDFAIRVRN